MRLVRGDVVAGEYEVERHVESTGAVDTYLARHLLAGRKVRLKIVRLDESWTKTLVAHVGSLPGVEDDGLVPCLAAGPAGKKSFFFAFGWEQGPTLEEDLAAPFDAVAVLEIGATLAGGLAAVHDAGLAHAHIRPNRVVLCQMRGHAPRLLDGLVPPEAWVVGSAPMYLAPEVVAGAPPSQEADVYALGAMLARMGAPEPWSPADGRFGKLLATLFGLRQPAAGEHPVVDSWITSMLAHDPAERPSAGEVHAAFSAALAGSGDTRPAPHSRALDPTTRAVAAVLLRPPSSKSPEAAGLDATWRESVQAHGTRVVDLVDGSLLCRIERGSPAAVATTAGLVVRTSQEHAFRASAVCGLLYAEDEPGDPEAQLAAEIRSLDAIASRTPAGVVRFTARLAARVSGSLALKPSGDAFVLAQTGENKRARRGGTLEMEVGKPQDRPSGGGSRRRKSSEIAVDEPRPKRGRGGTLEMEVEAPAPKRKRGGTLEIPIEPPTLREPEERDRPTLEVVVDQALVEATRSG